MALRHLRYFLAVADTGNLSRAAEKLFVAQPPLSLQIRQLEQELGTPLFVRHPKGMRLTPASEALVPGVRRLLEHASRLPEVARAGSGSCTLRLGIVPSSGGTVVPALVRELRAAYPCLNLRLDEMISDEQHQAPLAGRIDAGLARTGARHRKLRVAASLADPLCLALPAARAPEEATTVARCSTPWPRRSSAASPPRARACSGLRADGGASPRQCFRATRAPTTPRGLARTRHVGCSRPVGTTLRLRLVRSYEVVPPSECPCVTTESRLSQMPALGQKCQLARSPGSCHRGQRPRRRNG
jgi:DNA-binding transcriptional LysR family regulator